MFDDGNELIPLAQAKQEAARMVCEWEAEKRRLIPAGSVVEIVGSGNKMDGSYRVARTGKYF